MDSATLTRDSSDLDDQPPATARPDRERSPEELSRRRFTTAVVVGILIALPLCLWCLWDLWSGSIDPLRGVPYDNFYDLQARAMFHGHFNIAPGNMGIEAFLHDGKQYTYFGIFPSLIRMPILLVTSSLDRKLTAPSILAAWMVTALFSSLMLWRLRILTVGKAVVGRAEAASYGALLATIMGGSVILYLSATPFVYNEDFAWSVPLMLGSLFFLLGMMERPTWGRAAGSGIFVLFANMNRTPAGYACVVVAFLVAAWFALGRGGATNRRWALPLLGVAIVPFLASCAVTYAKFGIPIGLPMADQVWASVNAHRREFLAANGGKAFSFAFLPSTIWAYLQPFGIHFTGLFPFITPPTAPAAWRAGAVMDQTYPTASIPATMPLLFLLSCWGVVTAFRRKTVGQLRLSRIIVFGAALSTAGVLLWGYISERYMADFMPLLIVAASIGLIDIWRRLAAKPHRVRRNVLGVTVVLAVYCVVANLAIAGGPLPQWTTTQNTRFLSAEQSLSLDSLASTVWHRSALPYWAPQGQLIAINGCTGLYLSSGNTLKDVPGQQIEHYTWQPIEQSSSFTRDIQFTFNRAATDLTQAVPLMRYGAATLVLRPVGHGDAQVVLENPGTSISWPRATGWVVPIRLLHQHYQLVVTTDPNLHSMNVEWYGSQMLNHYVAGHGPAVVLATPSSSPLPVVTVADGPPVPVSPMTLCRSLDRAS